MSNWPAQPVIYEINTAAWLARLSEQCHTAITLDQVPQSELERLAALHFDGLWLMGVWQRSPASQAIARQDPGLQSDYSRALPDYTPADVFGSPYAVYRYEVDSSFGGTEALRRLRRRLRELDIRLMLDFIPNHVSRDHEWVGEHPERLVQGTKEEFQELPHNYFVSAGRVFAHGRDPNFPGWTDTVQIDYRRPETRAAVIELLSSLADLCDGLRCDMAMLVTANIFQRTWGGTYEPPGAEFWVDAIRAIKAQHPRFLMVAEVYWDLEYELQQQGFDYTYDKRLYERLRGADPEQTRRHLFAEIDYQRRLVRFIENHDEGRAAEVFGVARSMAVAAAALTLPGMRLIHEGQIEGSAVRIPVQLRRCPAEAPDSALQSFYPRLLGALKLHPFHEGTWKLLQCRAAWSGNNSYTAFVAHRWTMRDEVVVVAANMSAQPAQCYLPLEYPALTGSTWELCDLLSDQRYERDGDAMLHPGLYLDTPAYGHHIFHFQLKDRKLPAGVSLQSTWQARNQPVYDLAWSPDGRQMALTGKSSRISIVDAATGIPVRELEGHSAVVGAVAWRPSGGMIASGSDDRTVRIWAVETGVTVRVLDGPANNILTVAWSADSRMLAASGIDSRIFIWDLRGGRPVQVLGRQSDAVNCLAWSPTDGKKIASASGDQTVQVWDVGASELLFSLKGRDWVSSVAWSPDGKTLVTGTGGGTIDIWSSETGRQISVREGHTQRVLCVAFSDDGKLLASKSADGTVRLWHTEDWREMAVIPECGQYLSGLAFQKTEPVLATRDDAEKGIRIWTLDRTAMLGTQAVRQSVNYASAKVVVVGESSTGKTCLVNALLGKRFAPQPSTHATEIALFRSEVVLGPSQTGITREVMLWDLAGQADYQLVHQLFLEQTALALVLFDGARHDDPLAGVAHWENALRRLAGEARPRVLVAGRVDRGYPTLTKPAIEEFRKAHGFSAYVATSALTGEGIPELRDVIGAQIPWDDLPFTSSPELWNQIREFLVKQRAGQSLVMSRARLKTLFEDSRRDTVVAEEEFNKVIALAQVQGLVWLLSFGDYVLLKPELLNWYASAIVRMARKHEEGSVLERAVLEAELDFEDMERLSDPALERSLLHAVVELLLRKEIALREGDRLVFPSKFSLPRPEQPAIPAPDMVYAFSGPLEDIYATLIVRLSYSGPFTLRQLWKYAAEFKDSAGCACGFQLDGVQTGSGELSVHYDRAMAVENKLLFLKFIHEHLLARALPGSVQKRSTCRCPNCGEPVENRRAIEAALRDGRTSIPCQFCPAAVPLIEMLDKKLGDPDLLTSVREMETTATRQRGQAVAKVIFDAKKDIGEYDVFLAYSTQDAAVLRQIAHALKDRGLNPWFAEWNVPPGASFQEKIEEALSAAKAIAIFVGPAGLGPWEKREFRMAVIQFVKRKLPVIPVFLPGVGADPDLPLFLQEFNYVRFTAFPDDEATDRFIWGITSAECARSCE